MNDTMANQRQARTHIMYALGYSTLASAGLFAYGAWRSHSLGYDFLIWNLFLAWLPLFFSLRLITVLRHKLWSSWEALGISLLWLLFLPNSFYMISDFIHLQDVQQFNVLYNAVMFTSFISTGVVLGFASVYPIHLQIRRRFSGRVAGLLIALILFICSLAMYAGRDLRWNSWDVLTNPGGLLVDVSERLIQPQTYGQICTTVASFFVLLLSMYGLAWQGERLIRALARESLVAPTDRSV